MQYTYIILYDVYCVKTTCIVLALQVALAQFSDLMLILREWNHVGRIAIYIHTNNTHMSQRCSSLVFELKPGYNYE